MKHGLRKKYRSAKADREAAEYKEYLRVTKEIGELIRELSKDIVDESVSDATREITDAISNEELQRQQDLVQYQPVQPTFTYVDNAKPSLGRYKGVGTLPQGCKTCGARHRPL